MKPLELGLTIPNLNFTWLNFVHMTHCTSLDSDCMSQIAMVLEGPLLPLIGDGLVIHLPINIFLVKII
jgi:hypothetical protein